MTWGQAKAERRAQLAARELADGRKVCTGCKQSLPLTDFHRHAGGRNGRAYYCKACHAAKKRRLKAARLGQSSATH